MAKQAATKGSMEKAVGWTHHQEESFDDFFGKKLSYEGFTIQKIAGGYQVSSSPIASSFGVETGMVQKAEPGDIVDQALTER